MIVFLDRILVEVLAPLSSSPSSSPSASSSSSQHSSFSSSAVSSSSSDADNNSDNENLAQTSSPLLLLRQKQHQHLLLAINLCHEIAHTLGPTPSTPSPAPEPYFCLSDPTNELGSSWEHHTFGGKIQPARFDIACREGLVWFPWLGEEEEGAWIREGKARFWAVDVRWVAMVCSEQGWRWWERRGNGDL